MIKTIFDVCEYLDEQDLKHRRRYDEFEAEMVVVVSVTSISTRSEKLGCFNVLTSRLEIDVSIKEKMASLSTNLDLFQWSRVGIGLILCSYGRIIEQTANRMLSELLL